MLDTCKKLTFLNFIPLFSLSLQPYSPGQNPEVLKWKPHTLNSVDFVLNIRTVRQEGYVQGWGGDSLCINCVRMKNFSSFDLKFDH